MTCSSNTTCRPKAQRPAWRRRAAAFLLGTLALTGVSGQAEAPPNPGALISKAKGYLARGDGVGAQIKLRQALDQGAPRAAVAAYMGQAYVLQDKPDKARDWLAAERFNPASAADGFRALARLEQSQGRLPAAGAAFDKALAITPRDATMWVEIGRLRYAGGEHALALEAAQYALDLEPRNVRALEFRGQLVRDSHGLTAALPWFKAALVREPDDVSVLNEYAATLGELGRARDMLTVTRRVLELRPGDARAIYLQAVMAGRAGNYTLARRLLMRTGNRLSDVPGAMLLEGVTEMAAGNYTLAIEALERLLVLQPGNHRAEELLARALFQAGEYSYLAHHLADRAKQPGASPYLLTVVARAHEALGRRDLAGALLDRAAAPRRTAIVAIDSISSVGQLLDDGRLDEAAVLAENRRTEDFGHYQNQVLAGDVQLMQGHAVAALERYEAAARIRMPENLMLRRFEALMMAGRPMEGAVLVQSFLRHNPTSRSALRLAALLAARGGDWRRARLILEYLHDVGGSRDVQLLADLSLARLRTGDAISAEEAAQQAYRLQPASPVAALAWSLCLAELGQRKPDALALLAKARPRMGEDPLFAQTRLRLAALRGG